MICGFDFVNNIPSNYAAFMANYLWTQDKIYYGFIGPIPDIGKPEFSYFFNPEPPKPNTERGEPYELQATLNDYPVVEGIQKIINTYLNPLINYRLVYTTNIRLMDIKIKFSNSFSWSLVGTHAKLTNYNEASMNLNAYNIATILHEFGHALGLIHEHQRTNLPFKIEATAECAKAYKVPIGILQTNLEVVKDSTNFRQFDTESIMLYHIKAPCISDKNVKLYYNNRFSKNDEAWLRAMYYPASKFNYWLVAAPVIVVAIILLSYAVYYFMSKNKGKPNIAVKYKRL